MFALSVASKFAPALVLLGLVGGCSQGSGSTDPETPQGGAAEPAAALPEGAESAPPEETTPDAPEPADAAPVVGGKACGARAGDTCAPNEYCAYEAGEHCGAADAQATCKRRPAMCTREFRPVCGCDNKTYGNSCSAAAAGQGILTEGECPPSAEEPIGE